MASSAPEIWARCSDGLLKLTGHQGLKNRQGKYRAGADREPHQYPPDDRLSMVPASASRRRMPWWCWPRTCGRVDRRTNVRGGQQQHLSALLAEVNNTLADYEQLRMFVVAPGTVDYRQRLPDADHEDQARPH